MRTLVSIIRPVSLLWKPSTSQYLQYFKFSKFLYIFQNILGTFSKYVGHILIIFGNFFVHIFQNFWVYLQNFWAHFQGVNFLNFLKIF